MSQLWIPGAPGAPPPSVEEFIQRVHAQIAKFTTECNCEQVEVDVLLHDGRRLRLHSISPEPGFGWVTLRPFPEQEEGEPDDDEHVLHEELMVPLQSIIRIVTKHPQEEPRFGFVAPEPDDESGDD